MGYSANNVVNFEVITSTGEVLEANKKTHPDLYWALKGGFSNFGIVTRIDCRVIKTQNIWAANAVSHRNCFSTLTIQKDYDLVRRTFDKSHTSRSEQAFAGKEGSKGMIIAYSYTRSAQQHNADGPWAIKDVGSNLIGDFASAVYRASARTDNLHRLYLFDAVERRGRRRRCSQMDT